MLKFLGVLVALVAYGIYWMDLSMYRVEIAFKGINELLHMPQDEVDASMKAHNYLMAGTINSDTDEETAMVRAYYNVISRLLAIADIEKMYIPPWINDKKGLYENQLLIEQAVIDTLKVDSNSRLLDIGCGKGRISHHAATYTGGKVSGFNIDEGQIANAKAYAKETGMENRLDFKVGDHHKTFQYEDNTFDGSYSFQALWPFIKKHDLDSVAREMFRVMKPGARYGCSEYLLTPHFDWENEQHVAWHRRFLPCLAATQSNYPAHVTEALERAGFKVEVSAPSISPAWPLCVQKTDVFLFMRQVVIGLSKFHLIPPWVETLTDNMLNGGKAWNDAEKAKIADLNWHIVALKPLA